MDPGLEALSQTCCMPVPTGLPEVFHPPAVAQVFHPPAAAPAKMGTPTRSRLVPKADQEAQGDQGKEV